MEEGGWKETGKLMGAALYLCGYDAMRGRGEVVKE